MKLLDMKNISMAFGDRELFSFDSLEIWSGDRVGLVGVNGCGKTTLFKIMLGELKPQRGMVKRSGNWKVFKQFESIETFSEIDGEHSGRWNVNEIIKRDNKKFSGGEETRIRLADTFSAESDLFLLDEPTANLDIKGIEKLESALEKLDSFVLISHDRNLLDKLTNRTIEISDGKIFDFNGNYSQYMQWKEEDFLRRQREYENYVDEKKRLLKISENQKQKATKMRAKPKNLSNSEIKQRAYGAVGKSFGGKEKSFQRAAKHTEKRIEQLEKKEKPLKNPVIRPNFNLTDPPNNRFIIEGEGINFSYGDRVIFKNANFKLKRNKRIALVGENGCGKTTLLKLIEEEYEGIRIVPKAKLGIYRQSLDQIDEGKNLLENINSVSIQEEEVNRNVLIRMGFRRQDFHKSAAVLSGGEKIKLTFAMLFVSDVNVLLLDEPTNFLDIDSIKAIENLFLDFEGTMLFVSHDRHFIDSLSDEIFIIEDKKIKSFPGNLTEYEQSKKVKSSRNEDKLLLEMKKTALMGELSLGLRNKDEIIKELDEVEKKLNEIN